MRRALALLLVLAPLAGCLGGEAPPAPPPGEAGPAGRVTVPLEFVHEHAAFRIFLHGEPVSFAHVDYDLSRVRNMSAHLHLREEHGGSIIHLEGEFPAGVPDIDVGTFLAIHGLRYDATGLVLDTRDGHNGTAWPDTEAHRWQAWLAPRGGNFTALADGPRHVLRDGESLLLSYGEPTLEPRENEAAAVPRFAAPAGSENASGA